MTPAEKDLLVSALRIRGELADASEVATLRALAARLGVADEPQLEGVLR